MNPILLIKIIFSALLFDFAGAAGPGVKSISQAFCPVDSKLARTIIDESYLRNGAVDDLLYLFEHQTEYYGPCKRISKSAEGEFRLEYEDVTVPLLLTLSEEGKIEELGFGTPTFKKDSFEKVLAFAKRNLGKVSLFIEKDGKKQFGYQEAKPFNVGRNAQIFPVSVLEEKVRSGALKWTDTIPLRAEAKSLAFGYLHFWAEGTALSLDTLKNLILVEGDSGASDLLTEFLGKKAIEKKGKNLAPFLTHRDYARIFNVKDLSAIPFERSEVESFLKRLPDSMETVEYPEERYDLVDRIGWFATTKEVCEAIRPLKDVEALYSSGKSQAENERLGAAWKKVGLLQAKEWGVSQATWILRRNNSSETYCISLTTNSSSAIEDQLLSDIGVRVAAILAKAKR